jgi:serine O-acetyltransferase
LNDRHKPPVCQRRRAVCFIHLIELALRQKPYILQALTERQRGRRVSVVADNITSAESLWRSIRSEADAVAAGDAALGSSISLSVLDHPGLGTAVAFQIGQRLGTDCETRALFTRIANEAFGAAPDLVEAASCDLQAIVLHDPASKALLPALLNKGYVALQSWRVANWLWCGDRTDLALLLQSASSEQLQVSIHPSASIGTSVFLDHATGIIVGASVSIADAVTIMQNVTVGRNGGRAPTIGRGVLLSTGATILGDLNVGDYAKVGAGSVVTRDVPAGCTAIGVPARLTNCPATAASCGSAVIFPTRKPPW